MPVVPLPVTATPEFVVDKLPAVTATVAVTCSSKLSTSEIESPVNSVGVSSFTVCAARVTTGASFTVEVTRFTEALETLLLCETALPSSLTVPPFAAELFACKRSSASNTSTNAESKSLLAETPSPVNAACKSANDPVNVICVSVPGVPVTVKPVTSLSVIDASALEI